MKDLLSNRPPRLSGRVGTQSQGGAAGDHDNTLLRHLALAGVDAKEDGAAFWRDRLVRKTLVAQGARETVEKALEVTGGSGYFRRTGLELLLRDVRAADFHPLPEKRQTLFSGRLALGLEPV